MRQIRDKGMYIDSIEIKHLDKDGKVLSDRVFPRDLSLWERIKLFLHLRHNTMTSVGLVAIVNWLANNSPVAVPFGDIGIGTGTTASSPSDTWLQTALKVKSGTVSEVTTTYTGDTLQVVATFSSSDGLSGSSVAVTEVILANGTSYSAGVTFALLHQVYSPADTMNWNQGDQLQVTVKVQSKQG
jgi:hypothetical protein